jgi:hypothetical protein
MKKLLLFTIAIFLFGGVMAQNAITVEPAGATAFDELTLFLDVSKTCPDSALFGVDSVMIHSGVTIGGEMWQNVVAFDGMGANGQQPKLEKWQGIVSIDPPDATAWDEITLTLNANFSCPAGDLDDAEVVNIHSGITLNGAAWQNVVDFDATGANGQSAELTSNGDGTWSITFTPAEFYGVEEGDTVTAINCVFNGGAWDAGEAKDFDEEGNCVDFTIPLGETPEESYIWYITFTPSEFYGIEAGTNVTAINCVFNNGTWDAEGKDFDDEGNCTDFTISFAEPNARVQVIHNSADAAAAVVDVWLNDVLLLDDFAFRTASPFVDAPAGEEFTIAIKGPDSEDPMDPIWSQTYTLEDGKTYILVANGIVSEVGYDPAVPFDIYVYDMGREAAAEGTTDVLVFHGATDAPTVSVYEVSDDPTVLVETFEYGTFAGYLELPLADYSIQIRNEAGDAEVATYSAPLATLGLDGAAVTVVASGFLSPADNSDGPLFALYAALATGGALVELPFISSIDEISSSTPAMNIYPNPAQNFLNIELLQEASKIEVFNVIGESMMSVDQVTSEIMTINTSSWSNGVYFITIHTTSGIQTAKFMKN